MTNETRPPQKRRGASLRVGFYTGAALVVAGLVYGGFVYPRTVPPDPLTLLGIARLHLGLAQVIPEKDRSGKPVPFRHDHLVQAEEALDRTERSAPGLAITREFRAFKAWIEGDYDASARWYREALSAGRDDSAFVRKTLLNLAEVEIVAGRAGRASEELERIAVASRDASWYLARASVWNAQGRIAERRLALDAAFERARKSDQKTLRRIADTSFEWGDDIALSCYESLEKKDPFCWYRIARLKIAAGDTDSAGNALAVLREEAPALLEDLFTKDGQFWEPYRDTGILKRAPAKRATEAAKPGR